MFDPDRPPRDDGAPKRIRAAPAGVWPHAPARPYDHAAASLSTWPETARAIVKRLDAGADSHAPPAPARAIISLKGATLLHSRWDQDCAALFSEAGVETASAAVLFSCGGHDLIDALADRPRAACLIRERDGASTDALAAYVNRAALAPLLGEVIGCFRHVIAWSRAQPGSRLPLVLHVSGCHPAAGTQSGAWLRPAFDAAGVPEALRNAVTAYVYDKLAAGLASLHEPASGVHVVRWAGTSKTVLPMVAQLLARQAQQTRSG